MKTCAIYKPAYAPAFSMPEVKLKADKYAFSAFR